MKLTPEQIQENWDKLIQVVKDTFEEESERRENLPHHPCCQTAIRPHHRSSMFGHASPLLERWAESTRPP